MVATTTHFPKQAPCGYFMVDGDHHQATTKALPTTTSSFPAAAAKSGISTATDPCGYARFDTTARC